MHKYNFDEISGQGIKIAIIDSGLNSLHKDFVNIKHKGCSVEILGNSIKKINDEYEDVIGHGTACAGIIAKQFSEAELYIIKIFKRTLNTNIELLTKAIEIAIDEDVDIISLSLGTKDTRNIASLERVCELAEEKGISIICSESNDGYRSYPACFKSVIRVGADKIRGKYCYHYTYDLYGIKYIARGDKQKLCWTKPEYVFLEGTSFAVPHLTGIVAAAINLGVENKIEKMHEFLIENAVSEVDDKSYQIQEDINQINILKELIMMTNDVTLFPFNKEMHTIVNFRKMMDFSINSICDLRGRGLSGEDAGEVIGIGAIGIIIKNDFLKAIENSDTVIFGHLEALSKIYKQDLLYKYLEVAIDENKNVFSFSKIDENNDVYKKLLDRASKKELKIYYPELTYENIAKLDKTKIDIAQNKVLAPVLGVFGTSPNQGKFTCQLILRRRLMEIGYKVGQLGTEPHSELFGMDEVFPMGYSKSIEFPLDFYIRYVDYSMKKIDLKNPEIIIGGAQSGVIPHQLISCPKDNYTLPSLAFLMGLNPDVVILSINSVDSADYIKASISTIESISKAKVIALTMSQLEKNGEQYKGAFFNSTHLLSPQEYEKKKENLLSEIGLPIYNVFSESDADKLVDVLIEYLAQESGAVC